MSLKGIHKSKMLILITGIIIFAHAVIPHHYHHHLGFVEVHTDNLDCKTAESDNHSEDNKTDCHAFNVIVIENTSNKAFNFSQVAHPSFNLLCIEIERDRVLIVYDSFHFNSFSFSYQNQFLLSHHSLRGPPALV